MKRQNKNFTARHLALMLAVGIDPVASYPQKDRSMEATGPSLGQQLANKPARLVTRWQADRLSSWQIVAGSPESE